MRDHENYAVRINYRLAIVGTVGPVSLTEQQPEGGFVIPTTRPHLSFNYNINV